MNFVLNIDPRTAAFDRVYVVSENYGQRDGGLVYQENRRDGDDLYVCIVYRVNEPQ